MLGLQRSMVRLEPHQTAWEQDSADTIAQLRAILGPVAREVQHVGSTAIPALHAKPILDLAVGVDTLEDVLPYRKSLAEHGVIYRGRDQPDQLLFVIGDFARDTRTHHIHVVRWKGPAWNRYLRFRDYLRAFPDKALLYDECKRTLAAQFPADRARYTEGKSPLICALLEEARSWAERSEQL